MIRPSAGKQAAAAANRRLRPYYARTTTLPSSLTATEAGAALAALIDQPPLRGSVGRGAFWVRGGRGLGGYYPYATGEVDPGAAGTRVRVHLGMRPLTYAIEVIAVALAVMWTATAIMGALLNQAGVIPVGVAWRPYAGGVCLVLIVATIIQGHRLGNRQAAELLDRLRAALEPARAG